MVKVSVVNRDIQKICELTNSVYFTYDELHKYDEEKNTIYDIDAFLKKAEAVVGEDARKALIKRGILIKDYSGNYNLNIDKHISGGGINYSNIGSRNVGLFFASNNVTFEGMHTLYHEAAHSLQRTQKLFNSAKMDELYNAFCSKGLKKATPGKLSEQLVEKNTYHSYLCEMHSEAFATACLMLRSEGILDYGKQMGRSYADSLSQMVGALMDADKEYPSLKYYADLPVRVGMIKKVNQLRASGKLRETLADENGRLDFLKLSKQVESVVVENAYSPLTFKRMLNYEFLNKPSKSSKQWWGLQSVYAAAATVAIMPLHALSWIKDKKLRNYNQMKNNIRIKDKRDKFIPLVGEGEEEKQINALCKVDNSLVRLEKFCRYMGMEEAGVRSIGGESSHLLRAYCLDVIDDNPYINEEIKEYLPENKIARFQKYFATFMKNNKQRIGDLKNDGTLRFYDDFADMTTKESGRQKVWSRYQEMRADEKRRGLVAEEECLPSRKEQIAQKVKMVKKLVIRGIEAVFEEEPQPQPERKNNVSQNENIQADAPSHGNAAPRTQGHTPNRERD